MPKSNEVYYNRFKRCCVVSKNCTKKKTGYFISHSESSVIIHDLRTDEDLPAVLIFSECEGPDEAYLFVDENADFLTNDYFTWNGYTFFGLEEVLVAKDMQYVKYKVLQCNVFVNDSFWAYFKSALRSVKEPTLTKDFEDSKIAPTLIAPRNDQLTIGGQIEFNNQVWDIEDGDIFTITDIGYYALTRGMNSRDAELPLDENGYYVGSAITVATEDGYYAANLKTKLITRNFDSVTISPLESGELEITVLQENQPVKLTYTVKENA